jgi:hypothetical protein
MRALINCTEKCSEEQNTVYNSIEQVALSKAHHRLKFPNQTLFLMAFPLL